MFKMLKRVIFLLTTFGAVHAAGITEVDQNLQVSKDEKTSYTLVGKGEGVRHKRVTVLNIKVYQARLYFEAETAKKQTAAELLAASVKAVKLNPLRNFGGDKLKEAMLVSYEKNNIDANSEHQKTFLDLISKHKIEKDKPVYLAAISGKESDEVIITMKDINEKMVGPKGFANEIFSVWLGIPVDNDMTKLQEILIK